MKIRLIAFVAISCFVCASTQAGEDFPKLRPGLWESTLSMGGRPPMAMQLCIDAQTYSLMFKMGQSARKNCSSHSLQNVGGGKYVGDSVCTFGNSQATSHVVMTVTGDTAYHSQHNTHWVPARANGTSDTVDTGDSRWLGSCAVGMRAGDMVMKPSPAMPNGMRMNILDADKEQ